jgi:hypothetical protein
LVRLGFGLAVGVCAAVVVLAQAPRLTWSYASTDHFEAYVVGDEKRARNAVNAFERVHPTFVQLLGLTDRPVRRPRLVVFATAAQFAPYGSNDISNATWLGTPDGDFIILYSITTAALPDVAHEYTHLMLNRAGLDYPLWLNEGLAEYYSTMTPAGAQMRIGLAPVGTMDALTKSPLLTLDRLLAVDEQSPDYNQAGLAPVFYAQSWALTHMLLSHEDYSARAGTVLSAIALGTKSGEALTTTYGKSLVAIDLDLKRYLSRFRLPSSLVQVPALQHDTKLTSGPANDIDVEVTLASLLGWRPTGEAQSRAAMVAVEARAPQSLLLAEARGLLEIYTSHCEAARTYLGKAVALGSADAAVLRAYAAIIGASDPARQKALLDRAAAIAPDDQAGGPAIPCGR